MKQIYPASAKSPRLKQVLVICTGIIFGTACFFAGRLSVQPAAANSDSKAANETGHLPANAGTSVGAAIVTSQTKPASLGWDETKWNGLISQLGTVARNRALAEMLEKLAITDPKRAMALAQAEGNLKLRADLEQAALRGWSSSAPADAANWALALPKPSDRSEAMKTVFASAADADPNGAVRVAKLMMQQDPGGSVEYGSYLVDALCDAGNYEAAAKFAADGDSHERQFWTGEAYLQWAELQPEQAAATANAITDPDIRNQALHAVVGGWAETDPEGLAQFLVQLPPGSDRTSMLGTALRKWANQDPVSAMDWINDNSSLGPDLDKGVAAVANMEINNPDVDIKPEVMVGWAASITDPTLRSETVANVLRSWVLADLTAAQNYFNTTTDLLPADREQISNVIADLSHNDAQ